MISSPLSPLERLPLLYLFATFPSHALDQRLGVVSVGGLGEEDRERRPPASLLPIADPPHELVKRSPEVLYDVACDEAELNRRVLFQRGRDDVLPEAVLAVVVLGLPLDGVI